MTIERAVKAGAAIFFAIHIVLVTLPVTLIYGGVGESQGWLVYVADLPLVMIMMLLGLSDKTSYYLVVCLFGPLMYAAAGALAGSIVGRIIEAGKFKSNA